jgi:RHS repeat-associated protein
MNKAVVFNLTGGLVSKSNSTIGIKEYELSDHLGNVNVVILDRKTYSAPNFWPYFKSFTDYYPFGYPLPTRSFSSGYRYGFNGQEKDNEVYGDGKSYTAEYWQYDSRIGRRWNVDPEGRHWQSFYSTLSNNPVSLVDPKGNSDWKPDESALENGEVRLIAQKGDNIQTLSVQTGIPVEQLETYYGGIEFIEGQSYSFEKIPVIQKMNLFLQNYNSSQYNCMYFAMFVNSVDAPNFNTDKMLIQNNFNNKSSISDATIGNIVTYSESFEEFEFVYKAEAYYQGYDDESFKQYYISNFKYSPAHFAVVLLKTVDGKDIAYIIQKSGKRKVTYGIFPEQPKNYEDGRDGIQLFQISPINEKDKTPIYEKIINN